MRPFAITTDNSFLNNRLANSAWLILAATIGLTGCAKQDSATAIIRPALAYKIPATSGVESEVFAGDIHARIEADHAFRVAGKISQRLVDAGATVKKGQALARIDPQDVRFAAVAGKAQVAAQMTESDFADAELKRFQDLFNKGFVSKSALDQKVNLANAAKARLDAARAQSNVSINQESYATLLAETDGIVTQVMIEAGQVIAAGQPIMKIANPREKELAISVPESKFGDFKGKGAAPRELRVALWSNPDKYYKAKIREIGGTADPVTRTYAVRISLLEPDEAVQLGMSAYAVFVGANQADTVSVPLSALYVRDKTTGVWQIAPDGKVALRPVTVVQYRETSAIVKPDNGSLKPGDIIVAAGVHKLREGEIVKAIIDPVVTGDGKVALASSPLLAADAEKKQKLALLERLFGQ
ncbi:MAG: efflux RND transporter periplasmic adaptor subunit [Betaproteobacteria bacterium]